MGKGNSVCTAFPTSVGFGAGRSALLWRGSNPCEHLLRGLAWLGPESEACGLTAA